MNGDGSKQRYVSTFRMHIKPPGALSAAGNEPGTIDIRTSDKWTDIGKGCIYLVYQVSLPLDKSEHGDASW